MHFFVRCLLLIVFIALNRLRKMVILVCVTCKVSVPQGTFSVNFYRFWVFYIFLSGHSVALQTKMTTFHSISPFKLLHGAFKAHATGVIHKESIELRLKADFLSILTRLKKTPHTLRCWELYHSDHCRVHTKQRDAAAMFNKILSS